ncbi:MAG: glycosyltransferase family 9 protein [Tepidisphaeraceae bacterium]|jgi:ADP-heptose:LPS heptosyltransferase
MLKRNVLIFHAGALGDFLLTWPLALGLARIHPQSRIIYVTHPEKGKLADKVLGVEAASIEMGWHHLLGDPSKLPAAAARLLGSAHSIYSYISTGDDDWSRAVKSASAGASLVCLNPAPPADWQRHQTEWVLSQMGSTFAAAEAMRQMICFIRDRGLKQRPRPVRNVLIHPGSGSPAKCWPVERFVELARTLMADGKRVRFVLGEVELERWPASRAAILEQLAPVERPATYMDLLGLLSEAAAFVGNDSGPAHLAAMLGVPTVALFGVTNPAIWQPIGPAVEIVSGPAMDAIDVRQALDALRALMQPAGVK